MTMTTDPVIALQRAIRKTEADLDIPHINSREALQVLERLDHPWVLQRKETRQEVKATKYEWEVEVNDYELDAFLDMLRYERCTVMDWAPLRYERGRGQRYTVALTGPRFTPERWASFGLKVKP